MHVPFEGPGIIADWIKKKNHTLEYTRFHEGDPLPDASGVDMLVIMGGPMNVFDFHIHPWMQDEIEWVTDYISTGKPVLGICLGAQIIAAALGEDVYPGKEREIGWHNLQFLPSLGDYRIWKELPVTRKVFHWHGDTFTIPKGATRIASSQAFPNQGFIYNSKVVALQFHLEATPASVKELVDNCREELVPGPYIQTEEEILGEEKVYQTNQALMFRLLDYLCGQIS
ncbi:MAG: type 1 glutamine amidotransferase [Bacteroidota bacterium]